jgi:hypothetical protein
MTTLTITRWLSVAAALRAWDSFKSAVCALTPEMRWSYLPPLMVYFAAGVSGFTGIIESFFVKEHLGLSPAFLATLGFWAGLPWALKMPLGHLVDLFWQRKSFFVYLGAFIMALSLLIMVGLTGYTKWMTGLLPAATWYVISVLLAPIGFVLQDVVADAMTVEAVPTHDGDGTSLPEEKVKHMHVTMQTLGRITVVGGGAIVAGAGGWLAKVVSYAAMYEISLLIPVISVLGVMLGSSIRIRRTARFSKGVIQRPLHHREDTAEINWYILAGSATFVLLTILIAFSAIPLKEEVVFLGSLGIIAFLMRQLLRGMSPIKRGEIIAMALIIFIYRAMPSPGAGAGWWQIDVLGFDEAFFGTLREVSSVLAIVGMLVLRSWMGRRPLPYLVVFLSVYGALMMTPFVGMFYGLHNWTQAHLGFGAHTIALIDTMADSPMAQVAMIPMLAWIAREAPQHQKATYFAVMAAFTNIALSASQLGTKFMNKLFVIERAHYDALGLLMITVALIGLILPVTAVVVYKPLLYRRKRVETP